jgi:hypothetical protein
MKQPLYFVILFVFVSLSVSANDEQHVNAKLTNATVFLNRAQLTATTKVILNAGTTIYLPIQILKVFRPKERVMPQSWGCSLGEIF